MSDEHHVGLLLSTSEQEGKDLLKLANKIISVPKYQYVLTHGDTVGSESKAIQLTASMTYGGNGVGAIGLIGDSNMHLTEVSARMSSILGMPQVGFSSPSNLLVDATLYSTFLSTLPNSKFQGICLADLVSDYGWGVVNVVYSVDAYGIGIFETFSKHAAGLGVNIRHRIGLGVLVETEESATSSLHSAADVLSSSGVHVTLLFTHAWQTKGLLTAASEMGMLSPGYAWISSDAIHTEGGGVLEGENDDIVGQANLVVVADKYIHKGRDGVHTPLSWGQLVFLWDSVERLPLYSSYLADALHLYHEALLEAGHRTVVPHIQRAEFLSILLDVSFSGSSGFVYFNDNGDRCGATYNILNAKFTPSDPISNSPNKYTTFDRVGSWVYGGLGGGNVTEADTLMGCQNRRDAIEEWRARSVTLGAVGATSGAVRGGAASEDGEGLALNGNIIFSGGVETVQAYEAPSSGGGGNPNPQQEMVLLALVVVLACSFVAAALFVRRYRKISQRVVTLSGMVELSVNQQGAIEEVMKNRAEPSPHLEPTDTSTLDTLKLPFSALALEKKIGAGAFGEVWKGKYKSEAVAIKRIPANLVNQTNMVRFREELLLLNRLRHPNIVRVYGGCWDPPDVAIVMELLELGGMDGLLRSPSIGPGLKWSSPKLSMLIGVAKALEYLHAQRPLVLHRDVKAANVLVGEGYTVKLGDFGEAREIASESTMTAVGTPYWTAPEITIGYRYNEKADVFSFAMLIVEMVVEGGRIVDAYHLDKANGVPSVAHFLAQGKRPSMRQPPPGSVAPPPPPNDSGDVPGLLSLMEACWAHDPSDRPPFASVVETLDQIQLDLGGGGGTRTTLIGRPSRGGEEGHHQKELRRVESLLDETRGKIRNMDYELARLSKIEVNLVTEKTKLLELQE